MVVRLKRVALAIHEHRDYVQLVAIIVAFALLTANIAITNHAQRRNCSAINSERGVLRALIIANAKAPLTPKAEKLIHELGLPGPVERLKTAERLATDKLPPVSCANLRELIGL